MMRLMNSPMGKAVGMAALCMALLLGVVTTAPAQEEIDFEELLSGALQANISDNYGLADALSSGLAEVRQQAVDVAGEFGPGAITVVAPLLDHSNPAVVEATEEALQNLVEAAAADSETRREASRALAYEATRVSNHDTLLTLLGEHGSYEALEILWRISQNYEDSYEAAVNAIGEIGARTDHHHLMGLSLGMITSFRTEQGPKRQHMLRAMGRIGMDDFVPHLIWEVNNGPDKELAIKALGKIAHPDAYDTVRAYYEEHESAVALDALTNIMAMLPATEAWEAFTTLTETGNPVSVRAAGVKGLGELATVNSLSELIPFLADSAAELREAAQDVLVALEGDPVTTRLVILTLQAEADTKPALLQVLHERDPASGRAAAEAALNDDAAAVRVAALALLDRTPDADDEATYLEAARRGHPDTRRLGLQGYLSLAELALESGEEFKARNMFHRSLGLATDDAERLRALESLTAIASPETVMYLEAQARRESLQAAVARCAMAIAANVADSDAALAEEIYTEIIHIALEVRGLGNLGEEEIAILNDAQAAMQALGQDVDLLGDLGIVREWQMIGPLPLEAFDTALAPEIEDFDPSASYPGAGGMEVSWQSMPVTGLPGYVALHPELRPNRNVVAYARAVVHMPENVQSYVHVGSDDGIRVWVNGLLIHENDVKRELRMDQDVKPVRFQPGENEILVKSVQHDGPWRFILRLTNRQNTPLDFTH